MWGTIAALGISAVSALASSNSASKQAKAADRRQAMAMNAQQNELDFAKEQYDDWQNIFGPIQENLSEFYKDLTPDLIETQGLEAIEQERARMTTQLDQNLAQRGISDSGVAAQAQTDIAMQTAEQRAKVRAEAPMKSAQQKLGFLQVGLGQNPQGQVQQALGNQTRMQSQQAGQARQDSFRASQASQQAWQGLGTNIVDAVDQWGNSTTEGGD